MSLRLLLVSHLASPHEITGAERSLLDLAGGLVAAGHRARWLSPAEGRSSEAARRIGMPVEIVRWPRLFLASWQAAPAASALRALRFATGLPHLCRLARVMRESGDQAALVNTLVNVGAVRAARSAGLPVLWRVAEIPGPGPRRALWRRWCREAPQALVAVSAAVAEAIGPGRARVIPTGVEIPARAEVSAARAALRQRLGVAGDAVVVGHVGQLRRHKGQLEFVRAMVAAALPDVEIAVIGSEADDPAYARELRIAGAPLGARLHFPGFIDGGGKATRGLDLLAFTSLAPDPFPRVVLEAMAAGVAVVAFAGGGVDEAIDAQCGRLIPGADLALLSGALRELALDTALRGALGAAGRERVRQRFAFADSLAAYVSTLEEIAHRA